MDPDFAVVPMDKELLPDLKRKERHEVDLPLFDYTVIQLNRLSWREFVRRDNPVANALMAKMKIAPKDRPKVRMECLRMPARLQLDPARSMLIGMFIDTYLNLTAEA